MVLGALLAAVAWEACWAAVVGRAALQSVAVVVLKLPGTAQMLVLQLLSPLH